MSMLLLHITETKHKVAGNQPEDLCEVSCSKMINQTKKLQQVFV